MRMGVHKMVRRLNSGSRRTSTRSLCQALDCQMPGCKHEKLSLPWSNRQATEVRGRASIAHHCAAGGLRWAPRLLASTASAKAGSPLVGAAECDPAGRALIITGGLGSLGVLFALYGLNQVIHGIGTQYRSGIAFLYPPWTVLDNVCCRKHS